MSKYRITRRVFCDGKQYEIGSLCDESVAKVLGSFNCKPVEEPGEAKTGSEETEAPARERKPLKKASIK